MCNSAIKKINNTIKFLYRKKSFLDRDLRKMLVMSLVQPRYDYACLFWYRSVGKTKTKKLQICQNKCIRFIENLHSRCHIDNKHFIKLNWLNVRLRVDYITLCQVYNIMHNNCPVYLKNLLQVKEHQYNTRSGSNALFVKSVKTYGKQSFSYNGTVSWNSLPNKVKNATSKENFKILCKTFLMDKMRSDAESIYIFY